MNIMYEERSWADVQGQGTENASPNHELKGMHFYEVPRVHVFEEIYGVNGVTKDLYYSAHACT